MIVNFPKRVEEDFEEVSMDIAPYLKLMVEQDASDIIFSAGSPISIRLDGRIVPISMRPDSKITPTSQVLLTPEMTESVARSVMDKVQWVVFEKKLEIDFAYTLPDSNARFRVNVFKQQGSVSMVLRHIKSHIPSIDTLKLPEILKDLVTLKRGFILMVGATGTGKSTTLAAMLDYRNEYQTGHIMTIEDPIEFHHFYKKSIVDQREVGVDTLSYGYALKSCMRESPDLIMVGEVRDRETMEAVLALSNTGHLVISTLHANNAYQAMQRIVNMFPHEQRSQLLMDLSLNLVAIISQRLVTNVYKKRIAAVEVMLNTPYIAELILDGKIEEIRDAMATSTTKGMQTFDMALIKLHEAGLISLEEALANADSRTNLEAKIKFSLRRQAS